jgi:Icc-related predicted phosphoesterase
MAVKDLKRLLLKYESNLANKANYNASRLARVNTYNNRDYVVDLSKKTIIKNTKDNIRVAGRDEPTAAELENIWERKLLLLKLQYLPLVEQEIKVLVVPGNLKLPGILAILLCILRM